MPEIILIDTRNPQETQTIQLNPEDQLNQECLIGRDPRCCIVLKDNLASRTHGKIAFRNGSHFYSDLGSRNGSKINNVDAQLNQEYLLKPSDIIALGNHLLLVKAIAGEETTTVAPQFLTPEQYMPLARLDPATLETWTQGTKQLKCVQIINETVDVKTFSLVGEPPVKFNYQPGQFITLNLNINGQRVKRPYSISSTPSRPHTIEITVKRVAGGDEPGDAPGLVSNWLHDNLKIGNQLEVNAPIGKFTNFANPAPKLLLISAGSGITPMMSMSRWICDTVSQVDLVFVYSARSPEDIIFRQELEMMSSRYPNFKLAITITRATTGQPWYGYTGRINGMMLKAIASDYQERTVYVCGPNPFMAETKELLQKINLPMENYYEESFGGGGAKQPKPDTPTAPPISQISISNQISNQISDHTSIFRIAPPAPDPNPVTDPTPAVPIVEPVHSIPSTAVPSTLIVSGGTVNTSIFPPTPAVPTPNSATPVIVLTKSGQEVACDGEQCILDEAEAEGASLPFGCRRGICGACKVKKIAGDVIYEDDVACEDGFIYTCIARPVGRVVIEA
jgi:glycine betaine catabolism B